jgi:uridine phosphorylase
VHQADTLPLTGLPRTGLPARALVVGDPFTAEHIAARLSGMRQVAHRRDYRTFVGEWNGVPIVVASHGVGAPGALCLFQELMDAGVDTVIRLGTAGALLRGIGDGDLIIAESCVRDDGVTHQLVPATYPAAATPEVVIALAAAAQRRAAPHHRGVVWSRAAVRSGIIDLNQAGYGTLGVLAIEMELSALLVLASTRGVRAGGSLVIDGSNADDTVGGSAPDPHREAVADGITRATLVSLDALVGLPDLD